MKWNLSILADSGFRLSDLRAVGGAKNETWMQIKADILGVPLTTMRVTEATCMGAAMLAGGGMGILDVEKVSLEWAMPIRTFEPSDEYTSQYDDRFVLYKEIYNSLHGAQHMLHYLKGDQ